MWWRLAGSALIPASAGAGTKTGRPPDENSPSRGAFACRPAWHRGLPWPSPRFTRAGPLGSNQHRTTPAGLFAKKPALRGRTARADEIVCRVCQATRRFAGRHRLGRAHTMQAPPPRQARAAKSFARAPPVRVTPGRTAGNKPQCGCAVETHPQRRLGGRPTRTAAGLPQSSPEGSPPPSTGSGMTTASSPPPAASRAGAISRSRSAAI